MEHNREIAGAWEEAALAGRGYLCRRLLGQGAFSKVYWVERGNDSRSFACKVSGNIRLLERESQVMARLQHSLFPAFYGMWQEEGRGFLLMEYVRGENMAKMLQRRGRFSLRQTVRMGMELAEGLSYLHEGPGGLLFRDVKPANAVVQQDGRVRLLDLGCACALGERAASRAGTLGYAAPEQLNGEGILTAACDVYGWGQTMKAMLGEGRRSRWGGSAEQQSEWSRNAEPWSENAGRQSEWSGREEQQGGWSRNAEPWNGRTGEQSRWSGNEGQRNGNTEGRSGWGGSAGQQSGWSRNAGHFRENYTKRYQNPKTERQLRQLLTSCTEQEPALRIPDMRSVMEALAPLYSENGIGRGRGEDPFFGRGIFCQKNIVAIGKNT